VPQSATFGPGGLDSIAARDDEKIDNPQLNPSGNALHTNPDANGVYRVKLEMANSKFSSRQRACEIEAALLA
jgi:hypothetical protein